MLDLAIVGGGPGGLMSAWYLKKKLGELCRVTIFEASDRLGGKIVTRKFNSAPAMYEAGVAEIYDYSMTGPDPLREMIQHFGLQTIPMDAEQVQLDGELLNDVPGMRRKYGAKTAAAIEAFRTRCAEMVSPIEYYEGIGAHDNEHPWAHITAEQLLDREVDDATARRFFKVMARSDIATESHNTNGLNALKNFVMDVDGYIGLYSIQNGNEQLIDCLQSEVDADIQLNHRVLKVGKTTGGRYQLNMMNGKGPETRDFDLVVMCLPHSWLATLGWEGEALRKSMVKHIAYFDRPAHYLRVSLLFDEPFWGEKIPGAWFMSEAFGGCCVYNEGARHDVGKHGVLNFLIAGADALAFANLSDRELIEAALKSLPASLGNARDHFMEGKIHRWLSSVNALPGGMPARDVMINHRPEPKQHPGLVVVGDYLFELDPQRFAQLVRCRDRHHRHRDDAAAPLPRAGQKAAVGQDRPLLFRELSRARSLSRSVAPIHRSGLSSRADSHCMGQAQGVLPRATSFWWLARRAVNWLVHCASAGSMHGASRTTARSTPRRRRP